MIIADQLIQQIEPYKFNHPEFMLRFRCKMQDASCRALAIVYVIRAYQLFRKRWRWATSESPRDNRWNRKFCSRMLKTWQLPGCPREEAFGPQILHSSRFYWKRVWEMPSAKVDHQSRQRLRRRQVLLEMLEERVWMSEIMTSKNVMITYGFEEKQQISASVYIDSCEAMSFMWFKSLGSLRCPAGVLL